MIFRKKSLTKLNKVHFYRYQLSYYGSHQFLSDIISSFHITGLANMAKKLLILNHQHTNWHTHSIYTCACFDRN